MRARYYTGCVLPWFCVSSLGDSSVSFISLVFGIGQTEIGAIPLDCLLSERTQLDSRVTDYTVESGAIISDHIQKRPEVLNLTGTITAAGILVFGGGGRSKLIAAKDQFRTIHDQSVPITVVTGMDLYEDFALQSLSISRDNGGVKYNIDCTLKHINTVKLQKTDIPPEQVAQATNAQGEPLGKGTGASGKVGETQDAGKAQPTAVTSDLKSIMDSITADLGL